MKIERTIKLFKCYSSLPDEELIPLVEEYIATGRRHRAIIVLASTILLIAFAVGFSMGTLLSLFGIGNTYILNAIGSGIIIALSFFAIYMYQKQAIRSYLASKGYNMDKPSQRL